MRRFAIALLCLVAFAPPALARHHHHRHATHHIRPSNAPELPSFWSSFPGGGGQDAVAEARSQIGNGAVYGRRNLWCARFMNWVLERTGHRGTGSDLARSFSSLPHTSLHVGAIAVMGRRGGGHVGIVSGVTGKGDPIVISGNHAGRVRESVYARRRVLTFVEVR